jgi:hypothetical protein
VTTIEFINKLKTTPFSFEEYSKFRVSNDFINKIFESYNPQEKKPKKDIFINDPLLRLVNNYDLTRTEIGMISFDSEVTETEEYFYIGKFEVDFLCVSKLTKEVLILAFDNPLNIAYRCSQNSESFLEVMLVVAKFLERCGLDESLRGNEHTICNMAENVSNLVGGNTYLSFYKVLLGCNE